MTNAAFAQDEPILEEVVVTGSRIVRRDFEANSPLVTVDSASLEQHSGLNVENYLNQLSSFNPAASPVTSKISSVDTGKISVNFIPLIPFLSLLAGDSSGPTTI